MHAHLQLYQNLLQPGLSPDLEHILNMAGHGFDVQVFSKDPLIGAVSLRILEERLAILQGTGIARSRDDLDAQSKLDMEAQGRLRNYIVVSNETFPRGYGLIGYCLSRPEITQAQVARMTGKVLRHFRLETFEESFDAERVALLREVLRRAGLEVFVDAVVRIAFDSGFQGKIDLSVDALEAVLSQVPQQDEPKRLEENAAVNAFFDRIMRESDEPHSFMKAALSFYVVRGQGVSISKASRHLNLSRTTLQEHLRLAERYGVARLFTVEGTQSENRQGSAL